MAWQYSLVLVAVLVELEELMELLAECLVEPVALVEWVGDLQQQWCLQIISMTCCHDIRSPAHRK